MVWVLFFSFNPSYVKAESLLLLLLEVGPQGEKQLRNFTLSYTGIVTSQKRLKVVQIPLLFHGVMQKGTVEKGESFY